MQLQISKSVLQIIANQLPNIGADLKSTAQSGGAA